MRECPNCESKRIERWSRPLKWDRNSYMYFCFDCGTIWTYSYWAILNSDPIIYHDGKKMEEFIEKLLELADDFETYDMGKSYGDMLRDVIKEFMEEEK